MKIIHVCPLFYPSIGGNQIHVQQLSEKLSTLGDKVHVMTARVSDRPYFMTRDPMLEAIPLQEDINGVSVHRFNINYLLSSTIFRNLLKIRGGTRLIKLFLKDTTGYWLNGPSVRGLVESIGKLKPDILLGVMDNSFTTYLCYKAKLKYGTPFVFMPITHVVERGPHHIFMHKIYDAADIIIACTDFEKNELIRRNVDAEKIKVLPIGIKTREFNGYDAKRAREKYRLKDVPTVAYIGRMTYRKGIESLIEAMRIIWRQQPETQLLLAGKVNELYAKAFNKLLGRLNEDERSKTVHVPSFSDDEKKDLFAAADIFVMASSMDCFGLVYLEAWLCGTPVIACKDSPQESIIDEGENGLLVNYDDAQDNARAILHMLKNPVLRKEFAESGKTKVEEIYNLDKYANDVREIYTDLLSLKNRDV